MFRNRFALALATAAAAGSLLGLTTFTGAAQASAFDMSLSHSVNCSNPSIVLTATNAGDNPFEVYFEIDTTAGASVTSGIVVMGNSAESRSYPIAPGVIVERVVMYDIVEEDIIEEKNVNLYFSTDEDCTRPASDKVRTTTLDITCSNGWLHISTTVENIGDYPATVVASAFGVFDDPATAEAAEAAGWMYREQFTLAVGEQRVAEGDFKVDETYEFRVDNLTTGDGILWGPPRPLTGAELACGGNLPEVEGQGPSDTTVTTTPVGNESGAGSGSGGTLPSTGTSSWVLAIIGLVSLSTGGLFLRIGRRCHF